MSVRQIITLVSSAIGLMCVPCYGLAIAAPSDEPLALLTVVREACFERGDSQEQLRSLARSHGWTPAPQDEISKHVTEFSIMVGGWTFTVDSMAVAVMQSELRAPNQGHVCSVTAELTDLSVHAQFKSLFSGQFGVTVAEEQDNLSQHTDKYWINKDKGASPIKSTVIFDRDSRIITIRMIHGRRHPTES